MKRLFFVLLLFFSAVTPIGAVTTNFRYPDALSGWGTNANVDIPMDQGLDSRVTRSAWYYLERQKGKYNFGGIFALIDDAIRQNKKVAVGIMLKGNGAYRNEKKNGCFGEPDCFDGTPQWVVDTDPVIDTIDGTKMINYANPTIKGYIADLIENLMIALATQYPNQEDRDHFAILVCTGMDCEAQPEQNPHDQAYLEKWGANYENIWIDFVNWLVDTVDDKMSLVGLENKVRYLVISSNFKNAGAEKPAYLYHLGQKSNKWGLYSAAVSIGAQNYYYALPHSQTADEVLPSYVDIQDIFRKYCLVRPCLGEYGDAYQGGNEDKMWKQWWRAASALWQRVDGYYGQKAWQLAFSEPKNFFDTYAGRTFNTSPRAWVITHQDYGGTFGYPQRNFTFYLDQFDSDAVDNKNANTTPEWSGFVGGYSIGNYNPPDDYRGIFTRRTSKGRIMAFRAISDARNNWYIKGGPFKVSIEITYLDHSFNGNDSLSLNYSSSQGTKEAWKVVKGNSNQWITKTVPVDDAMFDQRISGADFYIDDNNDGDEYIHWASVECSNNSCAQGNADDDKIIIPPGGYQGSITPPPVSPPPSPCISAGTKKAVCEQCLKGTLLAANSSLKPGAWTAFGCVETTPEGFVKWLLNSSLGVAGGITFLLMLYGAFLIIISRGDQEKVNNGKEIIASAIAGLLMIIFSIFLLKVIGVDILHLPGFEG